jgi:putative flippase GtrA
MESIYKNFSKFFLVGCTAFTIDISIYFILLDQGYLSYLSKGISFICGLLVGYFLNSYFTFNKVKISSLRFLKYTMLYLFSLFVNMLSNEYVLIQITQTTMNEHAFIIAVLVATALSLIINFLGLRYYVFKK